MRVVLVGCGSMGRVWVDCALRIGGIEFAGFCDIDMERARALAEHAAAANALVSTDFDALLRNAQPVAVFDTVVPSARFEVVTKALRAGCHVLSEKPMAESMVEARQMVELAKEKNRIHAIIQNRRYLPVPRRIRRFLDSGALGGLTGVYCDFFLGPHFGGFREEMDHVLLLDMAIHTFDSARQMTGLDASSVYCHEWNPVNSWFKHGAAAIAIFEMERGVVFNYRGSWCAEGLPTSWESVWRFTCERGTLIWDGAEELRAERVKEPDGFFSEVEPLDLADLISNNRTGGHEGVIRDFIEAIQSGAPPETASADNIKSLAMVFGAIESTSGRKFIRFTA